MQIGKISRFGLLELSRQRLQPSLGETSYIPCPRCHGTGHIRGTESSALHILRILQEEAMKENTGAVHVQVPVDVATFLLNEKRVDIHAIEARLKVNVVLIPNIHLETPNYTITRLRHDELNQRERRRPSYKMATMPETEAVYQTEQAAAPARQEAAVKSIAPPQQPIPAARPAGRSGRAAGQGWPVRPHLRLVQEARRRSTGGRNGTAQPNRLPPSPAASVRANAASRAQARPAPRPWRRAQWRRREWRTVKAAAKRVSRAAREPAAAKRPSNRARHVSRSRVPKPKPHRA